VARHVVSWLRAGVLILALSTSCLITPNDYDLADDAAGPSAGNGGVSVGGVAGTGQGGSTDGGSTPVNGGAPAGGETTSSAGEAGSSGGSGVATVEPELLDDFDDNDVNVVPVAARDGSWSLEYDEEAGGSLQPFPFAPTDGTAYVKSDGAYSVVLSVAFRADDPSDGLPIPYDLSQYCGVSFRARNSDLPANVITARLVDEAGTVAQHAFGAQLETAWREHVLLFQDFEPLVDLAHARTFGFVLSSGGYYEFWIDDVSLLKKTSGGSCPA
jgi:hypothetical protein